MMESAFVTCIWFARFENEDQLMDYIGWKYPEHAGSPICNFADDIGLSNFDSDFLETFFVHTPSKLLEVIDNISFVDQFKSRLLANISNLDYADKNAILSLTGKKDPYGDINEQLFDFTPVLNNNHLVFAGAFRYHE